MIDFDGELNQRNDHFQGEKGEGGGRRRRGRVKREQEVKPTDVNCLTIKNINIKFNLNSCPKVCMLSY